MTTVTSKHTPGPWVPRMEQDGEYTGPGDDPPGYAGDWYETATLHHAESGTDICEMLSRNNYDTSLIAAAPELLACCQRALNESARVRPDFMKQLKAAIAKATGETVVR